MLCCRRSGRQVRHASALAGGDCLIDQLLESLRLLLACYRADDGLAYDIAVLIDHVGRGEREQTGSDTLIYRLLFNLTENAIRYNRPNGKVRVTVSTEANRLVIRVSDTGSGIPEQYRDSIFQPFFRVDKSRSREYGGVGLGLSLVWEIAALHGGDIRAEQSSEAGTTMIARFPLDE